MQLKPLTSDLYRLYHYQTFLPTNHHQFMHYIMKAYQSKAMQHKNQVYTIFHQQL